MTSIPSHRRRITSARLYRGRAGLGKKRLRPHRSWPSGLIAFPDANLFLKQFLDAVLGHEDVHHGDPQALSGLPPREAAQGCESEGVPGHGLDALLDPAHRDLEWPHPRPRIRAPGEGTPFTRR